MSDFLLDLGMSWTWSKALPYVLFLLLGFMLYFGFRSKLKKRAFKLTFILMTILPVTVYFLFNPIYEGDFSNNYREAKLEKDLRKNELSVIAIPNCPYCAESIDRLNRMVERTNVKRINFIVLTEDKQALKQYEQMASKKIKVSALSDFPKYAQLTNGRFPSFVYVSSPKMRVWSNDGFGVRAIDWVEAEIVK